MTTWYEAHENMVPSYNNAMAAVAASADHDKSNSIQNIWMPAADAFFASIPEEFERDWPELYAIAEDLGSDFVGVTSDTRRIVGWGADHGSYREFRLY